MSYSIYEKNEYNVCSIIAVTSNKSMLDVIKDKLDKCNNIKSYEFFYGDNFDKIVNRCGFYLICYGNNNIELVEKFITINYGCIYNSVNISKKRLYKWKLLKNEYNIDNINDNLIKNISGYNKRNIATSSNIKHT
jgi:hypothetical protein